MAIGAEIPPAHPAAIGTVRVRAEMVPGVHLALAATGGGEPWRWRSRGSDQGGRRCLLTRGTMGLMGETGKRFWLAGAWAPWQDGLRWSLRGCRALTGPGNISCFTNSGSYFIRQVLCLSTFGIFPIVSRGDPFEGKCRKMLCVDLQVIG
jgi:hypothetical protein